MVVVSVELNKNCLYLRVLQHSIASDLQILLQDTHLPSPASPIVIYAAFAEQNTIKHEGVLRQLVERQPGVRFLLLPSPMMMMPRGILLVSCRNCKSRIKTDELAKLMTLGMNHLPGG